MIRYLFIAVFCCMVFGGGIASATTLQQQTENNIAAADAQGVINGKDGWLFLQEELVHIASPTFFGEGVKEASKVSKKEFADPLPAIVDFNKQLNERGIQLIFMPIPPKALIYADKLPHELTHENVSLVHKRYEMLYSQLEASGVQVLDLFPLYLEKKSEKQLYCRTDTHFSGAGLELAADQLSEKIKKMDWYETVAKQSYKSEIRDVEITGDLTVMQKSGEKETLPLEFVTEIKGQKPVSVDSSSPLLLLGDSHTLVFSVGGDLHTKGAGLFDVLSADLQFPLDRIGVRGSGATPSRIKLYQRSRKDNSFLADKKLVVWCLSARELTGSSGWRKIPVEKK